MALAIQTIKTNKVWIYAMKIYLAGGFTVLLAPGMERKIYENTIARNKRYNRLISFHFISFHFINSNNKLPEIFEIAKRENENLLSNMDGR